MAEKNVLAESLDTLIEGFSLPKKVLQKSARAIAIKSHNIIIGRFDTQKGPRHKWQKLKQSTFDIFRQKHKKEHGSQAGKATDKMFADIKKKTFRSIKIKKGSAIVSLGKHLNIDSANKLFYFQQKRDPSMVFGRPVGSKPARIVMQFSKKEEKEIDKAGNAPVNKYYADLKRRIKGRKKVVNISVNIG